MTFRETHVLTALPIPGTILELVVLGKGEEARRVLREALEAIEKTLQDA